MGPAPSSSRRYRKTRARAGRDYRIVNLGLEPDEALEMGLASEPVKAKKKRRVAVANYVSPEWRTWLQNNRVELNAMSSAQFVGWLDRKVAQHGAPSKVVPPEMVLAETLRQDVEAYLAGTLRARITRKRGSTSARERR